jgi:hypothetical protein
MDEIVAMANNVNNVLNKLMVIGKQSDNSETPGVGDSFTNQSETAGVWDQSEITGVNESSDNDGSTRLDGLVLVVPVEQMDGWYGAHPRREGLRPQKPRDFGHLHVLHDTILTQYGVKQGLKRFGRSDKDAVTMELKQLHDRDVIVLIHASDLTRKEKH